MSARGALGGTAHPPGGDTLATSRCVPAPGSQPISLCPGPGLSVRTGRAGSRGDRAVARRALQPDMWLTRGWASLSCRRLPSPGEARPWLRAPGAAPHSAGAWPGQLLLSPLHTQISGDSSEGDLPRLSAQVAGMQLVDEVQATCQPCGTHLGFPFVVQGENQSVRGISRASV